MTIFVCLVCYILKVNCNLSDVQEELIFFISFATFMFDSLFLLVKFYTRKIRDESYNELLKRNIKKEQL